MKKFLNHIKVCAMLHNFLLMQNDEGTEIFDDDDAYGSDIDSDNELNSPVNPNQSGDTRLKQLTECWAEKNL